MGRQAWRDSLLGLGILVVLSGAFVLVSRLRSADLFIPKRTVTIISADSITLRPGTPIRNSGMTVGRLGKVERYRAGGFQTTVALRYDFSIHADAILRVRPALSGSEGELVLDPGSATTGPLASGQALPLVVESKSPLALLVDSALHQAARQ